MNRLNSAKVWLANQLNGLSRHRAANPAGFAYTDHLTRPHQLHHHSDQCAVCSTPMATPFFIGIGAIAAGLAGRHFLRRSAMGAADQWVKGGFKAKMDRKEALAVLGLKYVYYWSPSLSH